MNNELFRKSLLIVFVFTIIYSCSLPAQENVGPCYKTDGTPVGCGGTWTEVYGSVIYDCSCDCPNPPRCVPRSSSSSSTSSSNYSAEGDYRTEMVQSVVGNAINSFFNWVFSPNDNSGSTSGDYAYRKEQERMAAERRKKWMESVDRAKEEYSKVISEKFNDQKETTVNEFKNRYAVSEAVKSVKQLNCTCYQSIQAAKMIIQDGGDFMDLSGSLENSRQLADFSHLHSSGCPEIKIEVPDVSHSQPVGFQQMFYETIKQKADSISVTVALLKEQDKVIKKQIEEKRQEIEMLTTQPTEKESYGTSGDNNRLLQEALNALTQALAEEQKVEEEIKTSQQNIEVFEEMRSYYDTKKSEN